MLCIRHLSVIYPTPNGYRPALRDVSLSVQPGERVGILGESGCGKTTLALSMLGMLPPASQVLGGAVLFRDRDLRLLTEREARKVRGREVALIPQEPAAALCPVVRCGVQIRDVLQSHSRIGTAAADVRVLELLSEVGFERPERMAKSYPHQLSGGERQRVAIAQALCCGPALLIADEPTTSLDSITQAEVLELIGKLCRDRSMALILISHDPCVLGETTERLVVMHEGQIVEDGPASRVFSQPQHQQTRELLACRIVAFEGAPA